MPSPARGCLTATATAASVVIGLVVAANIYRHWGQEDAGRSFRERRARLDAVVASVAIPHDAKPSTTATGGLSSSDPVDEEDAEDRYLHSRGWVNDLFETLSCADACPSAWRPSDSIGREDIYDVSSSPAALCADRTLSMTRDGIPLVPVPPERPEFKDTCDRLAVVNGVTVRIIVLPTAGSSDTAELRVDASA